MRESTLLSSEAPTGDLVPWAQARCAFWHMLKGKADLMTPVSTFHPELASSFSSGLYYLYPLGQIYIKWQSLFLELGGSF